MDRQMAIAPDGEPVGACTAPGIREVTVLPAEYEPEGALKESARWSTHNVGLMESGLPREHLLRAFVLGGSEECAMYGPDGRGGLVLVCLSGRYNDWADANSNGRAAELSDLVQEAHGQGYPKRFCARARREGRRTRR